MGCQATDGGLGYYAMASAPGVQVIYLGSAVKSTVRVVNVRCEGRKDTKEGVNEGILVAPSYQSPFLRFIPVSTLQN